MDTTTFIMLAIPFLGLPTVVGAFGLAYQYMQFARQRAKDELGYKMKELEIQERNLLLREKELELETRKLEIEILALESKQKSLTP